MIDNRGKIYNFRPIVIICIFLMLGILLTAFSVLNLWFYAICLVVILFVFSCFLIYYIFVKSKRHFIITLILLISTFLGAFLSFIPINSNINSNLSGTFLIDGEIIEISSLEQTDTSFESKVIVKVKDGKLKGKNVLLYLTTNVEVYKGYKITCNANITKRNIFDGAIRNVNFIKKGVNYQSFTCTNVIIDGTIDNLIFKIQYNLLNVLKNSPAKNYGFIFALLTGDTNYVNANTLSRFRDTGVAHIFAVSGLHIGFLFAFLTAIFKLFKFKRFTDYLLKMFLLFLYVLFCGSTASCLRAFIIILTANFSKILGYKNDKLTTVFLSAIIVLLLNPYDLFSVGFLLSYTASLSLIFLTPKFEKALIKFLPNKVSKFIAPYLSAYFGTMPIINDSFGNSTALSMVFNSVIVPFMSFIFILCFTSCIIVLIFNNASFILVVADFFVGLIRWFVEKFSFITTLSLRFTFGVSALFYYFNLIILSGIFNVKTKTVKILIVVNNLAFITAFIIINFI